MRKENKTNCVGHSIFLAELPSNYVVVENSNKRPFLKVEGWALIREGRLFEGTLVRVITVTKKVSVIKCPGGQMANSLPCRIQQNEEIVKLQAQVKNLQRCIFISVWEM